MNLGPSWPWFHLAVVEIRRGGQWLGRAGSGWWAGGPAARVSFPLASGLSEAMREERGFGSGGSFKLDLM